MAAILPELLKSMLQLLGAALVAWLAVRWALARFKSERMWERQFSVLSDLLSAVFDLSRMLREWDDHFSEKHILSGARIAELREQYERQRQRIRDCSILAAIVVPVEAAEKIATVESDLEKAFDSQLGDHISLGRERRILNDAKREILRIAWDTLGTRDLHRPRLYENPRAWLKMKNEERLSYSDEALASRKKE
ncbi:hypothetical protein [Shinella sp. JR1-6]|uniref:hypothetical protein n=1 Tax=Shinella sp. JR1-6 TaxID=2527671 RepID=UPI00102D591E|nr:hypothetical protein [Shinella sp. JR1-6]TAA61868.1 hypothetical protein EXZ48_12145 [Shinella sp. JR1-6]